MLAGALLAGGMIVFEVSGPFGFSGSLLGLLLNVVICVVGSLLTPARREEMEVAEQKTKIPVQAARDGGESVEDTDRSRTLPSGASDSDRWSTGGSQ
jgi:hypothetical protein